MLSRTKTMSNEKKSAKLIQCIKSPFIGSTFILKRSWDSNTALWSWYQNWLKVTVILGSTDLFSERIKRPSSVRGANCFQRVRFRLTKLILMKILRFKAMNASTVNYSLLQREILLIDDILNVQLHKMYLFWRVLLGIQLKPMVD